MEDEYDDDEDDYGSDDYTYEEEEEGKRSGHSNSKQCTILHDKPEPFEYDLSLFCQYAFVI